MIQGPSGVHPAKCPNCRGKKTGYAVKIQVANIAGKLKTGMPSDLNFE